MQLEKIVAVLNVFVDNVWAAFLFFIAGVLALVAHFAHPIDKDLMQFASSITMTGAALFHAKDKKE